jgi:hypothetical protein
MGPVKHGIRTDDPDDGRADPLPKDNGSGHLVRLDDSIQLKIKDCIFAPVFKAMTLATGFMIAEDRRGGRVFFLCATASTILGARPRDRFPDAKNHFSVKTNSKTKLRVLHETHYLWRNKAGYT